MLSGRLGRSSGAKSLMNLNAVTAAQNRDISVLCLHAVGPDTIDKAKSFLICRVLFRIADHSVRWFRRTQKICQRFIVYSVMRNLEHVALTGSPIFQPFPDPLFLAISCEYEPFTIELYSSDERKIIVVLFDMCRYLI